jgi:hypothetical protein
MSRRRSRSRRMQDVNEAANEALETQVEAIPEDHEIEQAGKALADYATRPPADDPLAAGQERSAAIDGMTEEEIDEEAQAQIDAEDAAVEGGDFAEPDPPFDFASDEGPPTLDQMDEWNRNVFVGNPEPPFDPEIFERGPLAAGIRMCEALLTEAKSGYITAQVDELERVLDESFAAPERAFLGTVAAAETTDSGLPDVAAAYRALVSARAQVGA